MMGLQSEINAQTYMSVLYTTTIAIDYRRRRSRKGFRCTRRHLMRIIFIFVKHPARAPSNAPRSSDGAIDIRCNGMVKFTSNKTATEFCIQLNSATSCMSALRMEMVVKQIIVAKKICPLLQ